MEPDYCGINKSIEDCMKLLKGDTREVKDPMLRQYSLSPLYLEPDADGMYVSDYVENGRL